MWNQRESLLLKLHEIVCKLLRSVYNLESARKEELSDLLGQLRALETYCPSLIEKSIADVSRELQELFAWALQVEYPLDLEDRNSSIDACNELRLEILACALIGSLELPSSFSPEEMVATARFGQSGITHGNAGSCRLILFPDVSAEEQWTEIFDELIHLYEHRKPREDWLFDVSMLEQLPGLLLANLMAYANRLQADGCRCMLAWLDQQVVTREQLERAKTCFDLKLEGNIYFSADFPGMWLQPPVRDSGSECECQPHI